MSTDPYNEIINVTWTTANAVDQINALIARAEEADRKIQSLKTQYNQVYSSQGQSSNIPAPVWWTNAPAWFAQTSTLTAPAWYNSPPAWFGSTPIATQAQAQPVYVPAGAVPATPTSSPTMTQPIASGGMPFVPVQSQGGAPGGGGYTMPPALTPTQQMAWFSRYYMQEEKDTTAWQRQQMSTASALAQQRQAEELGGTYTDTSGLDRRSGLALALRRNIGIGKSEQRGLMEELTMAQMIGDTAGVDKAKSAINALTTQVDGYEKILRQTTNTSSLFNNQLVRHAAWVVQGALIAGAFMAIGLAIGGAVSEATKLSDVVANLKGMGATGDVTGNVIEKYRAAAQYGIGTGEAGQAALMEQRLNLSPELQQQGRELALIYGTKEYNNILTELYQTKRNLNAVGLDEFKVMDTLSTIYNRVTGSAEIAFDSIQASLQIYKQLGVSPEMAATSLARASISMEATPEVTATSIQRLIKNVGNTTTQASLGDYGIDATKGVAETIRQIIPVMQSLRRNSANSDADEQKFVGFMNLVSNAGMQSAGQAQKMAQVLVSLNEMFSEVDRPLDNMDKNIAEKMNSAIVKIDQMKAAWELMLATLTSVPVVTLTIEMLTKMPNIINDQSAMDAVPPDVRNRYQRDFIASKGGPIKGMMDAIGGASGGAIPAPADLAIAGYNSYSEMQRYVIDRYKAESGLQPFSGMLPDTAAQQSTGGVVSARGIMGPQVATAQSLQELPGGKSYLGMFNKLYAEAQARLKSGGFEDKPTSDVVGLTDWQGNIIQGSQKIYDQAAMSQAQKMLGMSQSYSFMDNIKGVSGDQLQSQVKVEQERLEKSQVDGVSVYKIMRDSNVRSFQYYDETTKTWREIKATQEEMSAATKEINKRQSEIKGVFNVPDGGQVMVAMEALMQGYTDKSRVPGSDIPDASGLGQSPRNPMFTGFGYGLQQSLRTDMSNPLFKGYGFGLQQSIQGPMPKASGLGTLGSLGPSDISISNVNPITVTVPINITIDSQVIQSLTYNKTYTDVNTQSRVNSGGGGNRSAFLMN